MAKRAPWIWPLLLIAGGVALLLHNFLLVEFDLMAYWPVLLVLVGLQLLFRGDIALTWQAHSFGITRGSVQSGSVEIESGELDVQLHVLHKSGRLVAGQYTARSRPELSVRNNRATLRMQRGQTWWLSLADWEVGLADDLPWGVLVSSYLGRLDVDLRGVQVERAYVSSGLGSVTLGCPAQAPGPIFARSTFGDVRVAIPARSRAVITLKISPFARTRFDRDRFSQVEPGIFVSLRPGETRDAVNSTEGLSPDLTVTVEAVFGTVVLS